MSEQKALILIDMPQLSNLYTMHEKHGIDGLRPLISNGNRLIILHNVSEELPRGRRGEVNDWLGSRPGVIKPQLKVKAAELETLKRQYFPSVKAGQRADVAIVKYILENKTETFTILSHDSGLNEWPDHVKKNKGWNIKVRSHGGLPGFYFNEAINGRISAEDYVAIMQHVQTGNLSEKYRRVFTAEEIEKFKTKFADEKGEIFFGARRFAKLGLFLGTLKAAGILGDVVSVAQAAEESAWHAERGDAVKAEKAWAKLAGDLSGGTAGAAAGGWAVAAGLRVLGVVPNPVTKVLAIAAGALIGGYAGGEKGKDFAGALHDYIVANNDGQALTAGLIARFARDYNNRHGILTPEELEFVRRFALSQEYQFFKREGPERFREIFGQDFLELYGQYMLDEAGRPITGYIATDEGDVFLTPDSKGGLREIVVPRETIDNTKQIYRDEGGTYKAVPTDAGTALYEEETGAFSRLISPENLREEFLKKMGARRLRFDALEPASPHYDPEMKIDFFGRPMRAGDLVDGDPDVGDVSYYPGDNDGNLTSGPRQPRFRKVPIMDLLLKDGVLRNENGEVIRASTGRPAGGVYDRFVNMQLLSDDGSLVEGRTGRSRVGARFIHSSGTDVGLGELFRHLQLFPDVDGDLRSPALGKRRQRQPLYWILHRDLPSPEDYVLQRSGFEPGHVRRQLKAANRFVKTDGDLFGRRPPFAPVPTPKPDRTEPGRAEYPGYRKFGPM
ncbi:hypothetical protein [Hoeflea prorocentri]|uniref:Uncharacterized protein n=1 Tax=Hoeflea prorocentri TaxID=1922333 RepID=A0A9X3ZH81_9HYPH|nr:hypothetical protein [Hoeflea prorocentri]MCY6381014.1 hypothetical protein [Hoeflea prorocentri]MDA5398814.1 hypothetical protein [Hoeflea prorocentri]